jgi:hypothetical protein
MPSSSSSSTTSFRRNEMPMVAFLCEPHMILLIKCPLEFPPTIDPQAFGVEGYVLP